MELDSILAEFDRLRNRDAIIGMARFGITPEHTYGLSMPVLRKMGKEIGKNHELALQLWAINTRETRILASLVDDPIHVTLEQMDEWASVFSYWEIVDQVVTNLFSYTPIAVEKAIEWSQRDEEYVRRAGFVMIARFAVMFKRIENPFFSQFFPFIIEGAVSDNRHNVRKGVSWALRQIGKRNIELNKQAIELARQIGQRDTPSARWVAADVLKDITRGAVRERLKRKKVESGNSMD